MQTFLPYPEFNKVAKCLDNKRLGKQRVEAKQILEINLALSTNGVYLCGGKYSCLSRKIYFYEKDHCLECGNKVMDHYSPDEWEKYSDFANKWNTPIRIPWENHPAVLMWRGYELALAVYGISMCEEWKERGYRDNLLQFFQDYFWNENNLKLINPEWWINSKKLCLSHQSNLVRKDSEYYRKYFPDVPDNLPYFWPIKKEK